MPSLERKLATLVENPRESIEIEIKDWLDISQREHQADLVKAILALANHGGGYILIGFREQGGTYQATTTTQQIIDLYNQDRINGIVDRYADPSFHVECSLVPGLGGIHPVISVPGGHCVPIRCTRDGANGRHIRQNAYYIRRPGPASEEPQNAQEWSELIRRCTLNDREKLLGQLASLLTPGQVRSTEGENYQGAHQEWLEVVHRRFIELNNNAFGSIADGPFSKGYWQGAYSIIPQLSGVTLTQLNDRISKCEGRETGWPIGITLERDGARPYPNNGCVETWLAELFREPDSCDFWRACPNGNFAIIRGYEDDAPNRSGEAPGSEFDFILPIWRVGEFLLHGYRFAREFSPDGASLEVSLKWTGLNNRTLQTRVPRYVPAFNRVCHQDEVVSSLVIDDAFSIEPNLINLVNELTTPLYEAFNFFSLPMATITTELNAMRGRR